MTKSKNENAISKIIKTRRKELDLTQQEFALRVGVGLRIIREIEQESDHQHDDCEYLFQE